MRYCRDAIRLVLAGGRGLINLARWRFSRCSAVHKAEWRALAPPRVVEGRGNNARSGSQEGEKEAIAGGKSRLLMLKVRRGGKMDGVNVLARSW